MDEKMKEILDAIREHTTSTCTAIRGRACTTFGRVGAYTRSAIDRLSMKERIVIIFVIGIALGFALKNSASRNITIGYDDYTVKNQGKAYDLIAMQRRLAEKALNGESAAEQSPQGGVCQ